MNIFNKKTIVSFALLALTAAEVAHAQTFYSPYYRSQTGTESTYWMDTFTNAYGSANNATTVAPGGSALANASVTQTTPGAFIIGGSAGDIYSFSSTNIFVLNYSILNSASLPNGVGNVLFQTYTEGNPINLDSVVLSYTTASGTQTLTANPFTVYDSANSMGGDNEILAWAWNLPISDDATSFSIAFNGSDTSVALAGASLDVAGFNATATPEPNTIALAGIGGLGILFISRRFRQQTTN